MSYTTSCTRCGTSIPGPSPTRLCDRCSRDLHEQARGKVDPAILEGWEHEQRR